VLQTNAGLEGRLGHKYLQNKFFDRATTCSNERREKTDVVLSKKA
jgi:hypothetical protein